MDNSVLGVYFDMANELGMGWRSPKSFWLGLTVVNRNGSGRGDDVIVIPMMGELRAKAAC
jgi:hypothetical protein